MEEDDEFQSHPSPDSGSPVSPPSNGRITVTVAAAPPQKPLTLALPMQQGRTSTGNGGGGGGSGSGGGGGGVGGGREDCWSESGTKLLIDAWGERYLELSRGNLKQKHWKEVADVVSRQDDYSKTPKTDIQCKNRIDTVKKKYKAEKAKISAGGGPSKWLFYERLDYLIGPTTKIGASPLTPSIGGLKVVPVGIPVGSRSAHQFLHQQQQQQKPKQNLRRRAPVDSDSSHSDPEPSPDSTDSFPPDSYERKRPRIKKKNMNSINPQLHHHHHHHPVAPPPLPPPPSSSLPRVKDSGVKEDTNRGNSVRELTRAIIKFGEAFEQAETSKLQQVVEMEKQRMKFAKELELQRMQFFMKTQLELSQIKHRRVGNNNNHHLNNNNSNNNNTANNNNNNSESSS